MRSATRGRLAFNDTFQFTDAWGHSFPRSHRDIITDHVVGHRAACESCIASPHLHPIPHHHSHHHPSLLLSSPTRTDLSGWGRACFTTSTILISSSTDAYLGLFMYCTTQNAAPHRCLTLLSSNYFLRSASRVSCDHHSVSGAESLDMVSWGVGVVSPFRETQARHDGAAASPPGSAEFVRPGSCRARTSVRMISFRTAA